jgi:formylmethanofuran dehydrogenase subunit B
MDRAWIDRKAVTLKAAIAEAAKLLGASRFPVIAGLGTDVAGARAAIALAQRLGAAIDHVQSEGVLRVLDVMRESGAMITTTGEARARADYLLLVGPQAATAFSALPWLFSGRSGPESGDIRRRIGWICPDRVAMTTFERKVELSAIGRGPADLPLLLAALRARIAGRPVGKMPISQKALDTFAAEVKAARFGVAIWSASALGPPETEMLQGMVTDLNARTRFSSLPLGPGDNALGLLFVCGWMTGFPMRTSFGRPHPEHDPWRFDAVRMVEAGEVDCAVWISAYGGEAPGWTNAVPVIALTAREAPLRNPAHVTIEVGRPGIDHDAVEYTTTVAALASITATKPSSTVSVAQVLSDIATILPSTGA